MSIADRLSYSTQEIFECNPLYPRSLDRRNLNFIPNVGLNKILCYHTTIATGFNIVPVFVLNSFWTAVGSDTATITIPFMGIENLNTFRSASGLILNMLNEGILREGELRKVIFDGQEYYSTKGLLLDSNFTPLLVISNGIELEDEENEGYKKYVEIHSKVFNESSTNKLFSFIVKKLLPMFTAQDVTITIRNNIEVFSPPFLPNKISTLQGLISNVVKTVGGDAILKNS